MLLGLSAPALPGYSMPPTREAGSPDRSIAAPPRYSRDPLLAVFTVGGTRHRPGWFGKAAFAQIEFATDSPLEEAGFELFVPLGVSISPSWWSRARKPHNVPDGNFSLVGPIVRIHFPPAESRANLEPIWRRRGGRAPQRGVPAGAVISPVISLRSRTMLAEAATVGLTFDAAFSTGVVPDHDARAISVALSAIM